MTALELSASVQKQIDTIRSKCERIKPLVVIRCITYNHGPYIKDALEGFVMQKTDFPFVAIVHDDASTDKTAEIVKEYSRKYPDIILPIYEEENQYSKKDGSFQRIINAASTATSAKYIALCEGDDYWTNPLKLQKQVDFLNTNSDYGLCYTKVIQYYQHSNSYGVEWGGYYEKPRQLLKENTIATLTVMIRKEIYNEFLIRIPPHSPKWIIGDYPCWLYVSITSKIKFLDFVSGVYRILPESASHTSDIKKNLLYYNQILEIKQFFINKFNLNYNFTVENKYLMDLISFYHSNQKDYIKTKKDILDAVERVKIHSLRKKLISIVLNNKKLNSFIFTVFNHIKRLRQ